MRSLKVLVIAMGVILIGGMAALVVAVSGRIEARRVASGAPTAATSAAPHRLSLPAGARILGTELAGDRLLVRVALAEGGEELWLIDARSGTLVATVAASTKP
jgi:hypothetical protein